ncbi:MAG: DNA polymerase IV, partial [Bacteroidales bacterium]|nr:DNA polymerase IV [Bacteroidales bacterium]
VVSGDPNDRRSIVAARSIPAKKLGINTAEPVSMALRKCPSLVIVGGDWQWYGTCSANFMAICRTYSPILQKFSIDECFLDMTDYLDGKDPVKVARTLKDDIETRLGFTVNIGVGSNKLLAKMASDFEKPNKVHTLWLDEVETRMWPLSVRDLLWVGKRTEERLTSYGIDTIGKLARLGIGSLTRLVGQNFAQSLHENANGIDNTPVDPEESEAKSYSVERTLAQDITDAKTMDRVMFNVACEVAHRIRKDDFRASVVSLMLKTSSFEVRQRQNTMEQPTDITALILNECRRMLPDLWDGQTPIRLVGIGLTKLTHDKQYQLSLFEDEKMEYYRQWDRDYDAKMAVRDETDRHKAYAGSDALLFSYRTGEEALSAAKKAIKADKTLSMERKPLPDGTDCFEVRDSSGKAIEKYIVVKSLTK